MYEQYTAYTYAYGAHGSIPLASAVVALSYRVYAENENENANLTFYCSTSLGDALLV